MKIEIKLQDGARVEIYKKSGGFVALNIKGEGKDAINTILNSDEAKQLSAVLRII